MKVSGRITILLAITAAVLTDCSGNGAGGPPSQSTAEFTDIRDGKVYKTIPIGRKNWMAENMNYDVPDDTSDVCYENSAKNCEKYGRLYTWDAAQQACPAGYHLPTDNEWEALVDYVGGKKKAGIKLKSSKVWESYKYYVRAGTDEYLFSALPGGSASSGGAFSSAGKHGIWWSATESDTGDVWTRGMGYGVDGVVRGSSNKTRFFSVRCVAN